MSMEYNWYIAIKNKDGKLDFFPGSYHLDDQLELETETGKWLKKGKKKKPNSIMWRTGSFIYEVDEVFNPISQKELANELAEAFAYTDWDGKKSFSNTLCGLSLSELNHLSSDYIKKGYFLARDVDEYEKNKDTENVFWEHIGPQAYANLAAKQVKRHVETDDEGFDYTVYGYEDYMYYAYEDYECKEYLIHLLQVIANSYNDILGYSARENGIEVYVLMDWS